ncbi:MAG: aminopeptidase, partial [Acidobacteria bacterium]|nr:aminopeptidase [Acidobacteriota bacterium]
MQINVETQKPAAIETEALVTYCFDKDDRVEGVLAELDAITGGRIKGLAESGELSGKMLEFTLLHMPPGFAAKRLLIVGAGKADKFGNAELRRVAGAALRHLKAKSIKTMAFLAREGQRDAACAQAVTEGLLLANFDPDQYKTDKKNGPKKMEAASLLGWDANEAKKGEARGRVIAESQNFARELINEPSNKLTPTV